MGGNGIVIGQGKDLGGLMHRKRCKIGISEVMAGGAQKSYFASGLVNNLLTKWERSASKNE